MPGGGRPAPGEDGDAGPLVVALAEVGAEDLPTAGGKGANLGELVRAGFPVPDGFVVTTHAYRLALDATGLGERLAALLHEAAAGADLRAAIVAVPLPESVADDIRTAYARLGGGPVAVRSSATAEDLPGAAFAGQQDSYLDVAGEEALLRAVTRCWASLWTDRAISYRARRDVDPQQLAMAVVVQRLVAADAAGVLFSANPVSGARDELVLDVAPGLGEAVVSGTVRPEHYVLDRRGRVRDWSPGETGGRTPLLPTSRLVELAAVGQRVAAHFGRPQDVEWAIAGGTLWLLQARPMTALPPEPLRLNPVQKRIGPFFVEMFQVRPYPLDVSGWFELGIVAMLDKMAGSVGVVFPRVSALLPEEDGVVVRLVPPVPRPTLRTLAAPVSIARRVRRYDARAWTADPRFAAFLAEVEKLQSRALQPLAWSDLVADARRAIDALGLVADLRVCYLPSAFVPAARLRLMLLLLGRRSLGPALLAGAETMTSRTNRALAELAAEVRGDERLRRAFDDLEPAELVARLAQDPALAAFAQSVRRFQAAYGHRETVSIVLSSAPTWSEAPEVVLGLVKVLVGDRLPEVDQTGEALRGLLAHPALRSARLRRLVLRAVDGAKTGMAFREDSHFYATMALPPLRRALLEMGRRLQAAGVLEQPEELFHLRWDELTQMADGAALAPEERAAVRAVVRARAARREALAAFPLLDPSSLFATRTGDGDALLTGAGSSRGTATGPVRIIRGTDEFARLRSGEVLVCPSTNPSWTPLFQRAVAVVVDTGGMGSHAAIVAREYGTPAVMGTGRATSVLHDGQRVTVDGTRGRVTAAADS